MLKQLGILDAVEWVPTNALYEVRGGPVGEPLLVPDNFDSARVALTERFPNEGERIANALSAMEAGVLANRTA